jgi:hypothetical protein
VLFLPVSLMTSYFAVPLSDMADTHTARTFWVSFAVVMGISFLSLFFFSKLLMSTTERLEKLFRGGVRGFQQRSRQGAAKANAEKKV